jgi:excisionase family DNA binding protein
MSPNTTLGSHAGSTTGESITPLLLTPRHAALLLAVSERTLWGLADRGDLPRVLIGRAVRYRLRDLEEYCERMARSVTTPAEDRRTQQRDCTHDSR